jgi:hypothetical protein
VNVKIDLCTLGLGEGGIDGLLPCVFATCMCFCSAGGQEWVHACQHSCIMHASWKSRISLAHGPKGAACRISSLLYDGQHASSELRRCTAAQELDPSRSSHAKSSDSGRW